MLKFVHVFYFTLRHIIQTVSFPILREIAQKCLYCCPIQDSVGVVTTVLRKVATFLFKTSNETIFLPNISPCNQKYKRSVEHKGHRCNMTTKVLVKCHIIYLPSSCRSMLVLKRFLALWTSVSVTLVHRYIHSSWM